MIKTVTKKKKAQADSILAPELIVSQVFEFRDEVNASDKSIDLAGVVALNGKSMILSHSNHANTTSVNKKKIVEFKVAM